MRNNKGQFIKGHQTWLGKKLSEEHKEKLSQAKLEDPVRYWLGKKRKIKSNRHIRPSGYAYLSFSMIEPDIQIYFEKFGTRPIPEHQYIWIKYNNREIPKGYVIHHLNWNKSDNRIENLELMLMSEHSRTHSQQAMRRNHNVLIQ